MKIGHQIFELSRGINGTNVLTKFHEDQTINVASKNCPPPGGHVFSPIWTIFKLFHYGQQLNTAPPPGGHDFQRAGTIFASSVTSTVFTSFELSRGINGTNLLTKFYEDRTISVASRVFTWQNVDAAGRTN
ncbi:hypothetical protein DPMN_070623 [Dreissena polymorpha]|uniref:Uncharacterized protein n=1 Tax=Dreissena polymorpha TaxID=45954 RepID=A0A9D4BX84_DREPO|nr:hypothetical protein DPMN_070623 [Dreissena polymorpha]